MNPKCSICGSELEQEKGAFLGWVLLSLTFMVVFVAVPITMVLEILGLIPLD